MEWAAKHFIFFIEKDVINAPGIGANRNDGFAIFPSREREAVLNFAPNSQNIPPQRISQVDWSVWKTMDFLYLKTFTIPKAGDDTAALGAKVDGEVDIF